MTANYLAVVIDQDRDIEAESLNAFGNLLDLLLGVAPRIAGVRAEFVDSAPDHL
jgi:hypothetical protein